MGLDDAILLKVSTDGQAQRCGARRQLSESARAAIAAGQRRRWSNPIRGSEHALQAAILSHIRHRLVPGVFVFTVPNGGARDPVTGAGSRPKAFVPASPTWRS
jgi:hypothetical protein